MTTLPILLLTVSIGPAAAPPISAEQRAISYLSQEIPRWAKENRCYSCHHNADAARALYAAVAQERKISADVLADTTRWMRKVPGWDHNGGEGPFNDKKLARLQFAATLVAAQRSYPDKDTRSLEQAAKLVLAQQHKNGSWPVVPEGNLGSPTTHGNALATALARDTLAQIDARRHREAITRADEWLRSLKVTTVLDAAAVLFALGTADDREAIRQRTRCLELIRKGEEKQGGWGPYVNSLPEVFDTSVVILALSKQKPTKEIRTWIRRGRAYLLATQYSDGSWPETTRPAGSISEPLRMSTTGWALLALLAS